MNLKVSFLKLCENKEFEINQNQLAVVEQINVFYLENFKNSIWKNFFFSSDIKPGFYLVGGVGVGKTMILDFFYEAVEEKKLRLHFNEFMIGFHDFWMT